MQMLIDIVNLVARQTRLISQKYHRVHAEHVLWRNNIGKVITDSSVAKGHQVQLQPHLQTAEGLHKSNLIIKAAAEAY